MSYAEEVKFLIVEMKDEVGVSVDIVPKEWYLPYTRECAWPPVKNVTTLVKNRELPDPNWQTYPARILHEFATYENARGKIEDARITSDLSASELEAEVTRKKRKRYSTKRLGYDDSDCENESQLKRVPTLKAVESSSRSTVLVSRSSFGATNINTVPIPSDVEASPIVPPLQPAADSNPSQGLGSVVTPTSVSENDLGLTSGLQDVGSRLSSVNVSTPKSHFSGSCGNIRGVINLLCQDVTMLKKLCNNIDQKLDVLLEQNRSHPNVNEATNVSFPLPVSSPEDFKQFEANLSDDRKENYKLYLAQCGGSSIKDHVSRSLKRVFAEECAVKYSLWGQKGNENFSATTTYSFLKVVLLSKFGDSRAGDEKDIEKAVGEWFRHANERLKKKIGKAVHSA